jgi:hypothetical protein
MGSTHTRTHLTEPIEDPVKDDEEGQDLHDGKDCAADNKAEE